MPVLFCLAHRLAVKKNIKIIEDLKLDITFDQFMVLAPIWKEECNHSTADSRRLRERQNVGNSNNNNA